MRALLMSHLRNKMESSGRFARFVTWRRSGTHTIALSAKNVFCEWIITVVGWCLEPAWVTCCIGYFNYQYFLLFAFYGSIWMTITFIFATFGNEFAEYTNGDTIFYTSGGILLLFGWFMFFSYGLLALKGLTAIEAADKWTSKREDVDFFSLTIVQNA